MASSWVGLTRLAVFVVAVSACSGKVKEADGASATGGQSSASNAGSSGGSTASTNGTGSATAGSPTGTTAGSATGSVTAGATGTTATGSTDGFIPVDPQPCVGAIDPRLVVAPQRILRLTMQEMVNSIRALVDATVATSIVTSGKYGNIGLETDTAFPPLDANREGVQIDDAKFQTLDAMAQEVSQYVGNTANFAGLTSCATPVTDECATTYVNALAEKAYRRPLDADEKAALTALYTRLRNGADDGNGGLVTFTVQEATEHAVYAIFSTPQLLYRSEIGDSSKLSIAPPGVPLTQYELASDVAFFLTDSPPDATLLGEAAAGTLNTNLAAEVDRLLTTPVARDWLRTVMYTFYGMHLLFNTTNAVDPTRFPVFNLQLLSDERTEAQRFLDSVLWNGNLTDILTSRTTFLNTNLASTIYNVPAPPGATATTFVETALPADQRIGLLTNAAFLTLAARSDRASVMARGRNIKRTMTCVPSAGPPPSIVDEEQPFITALASQTAQQQVTARAMAPHCVPCHSSMDPYGLALDGYDNLARSRTIDELGQPVDPHTTLPPELGSGTARDVFDVAQRLAASPVFTNCMAQTVLQYALTDVYSAPVKLPSVPNTPFDAACAASDVANRYLAGQTKTFSDMVRAVTASPAFVLRTSAP